MKMILTASDIEAQRLREEQREADHATQLKQAKRSGFWEGVMAVSVILLVIGSLLSLRNDTGTAPAPAPTPGFVPEEGPPMDIPPTPVPTPVTKE